MEKGALATIADKDGATVLHKACEHSHLEMVKLLVSYGASIDEKNKEGKIPMDCCDLKAPDGNKCKGLMFQVALVREEETYGSGASGLNVAKKLQATMTNKYRETAEELEVTTYHPTSAYPVYTTYCTFQTHHPMHTHLPTHHTNKPFHQHTFPSTYPINTPFHQYTLPSTHPLAVDSQEANARPSPCPRSGDPTERKSW